MHNTANPSLSVPFDQINNLAYKLRQAGAKFNVSGTGVNRILNFQMITPTAEHILDNLDDNSTEISAPISTDTRSETQNEPDEFATLEQLLQLPKTKLKQLAKTYKIPLRSKLNSSELANALVNQVKLNEI